MSAPAPSPLPDAGASTLGSPVRLAVVPTPQPPIEDPDRPVQLVLPGLEIPRPPHRPGPRPRPEHRRPDADFGPEFSRRAELPDPRDAGRRLVTFTLEAFAGRRPMAQLRPLTSPALFAAVTGRRRPGWCAQGTAPFAVGRVHLCEPVDGVAEISAVVRRDRRAHAVAARLEGIDGRWLCTALQIG